MPCRPWCYFLGNYHGIGGSRCRVVAVNHLLITRNGLEMVSIKTRQKIC